MVEKRGLKLLVLLLALIGLLAFFMFAPLDFIGFSIFLDSGQSFVNGTFVNTVYNGSDVVLFSSNTAGNYTSQVFDAGNEAIWSNISLVRNINPKEYLFAVDASGAVYSSFDDGVTWTQKTAGYGRGGSTADMFHNTYLYILFSGTQKQVYKSGNLGTSWSLINDTFSNKGFGIGDVDSNGNLYMVANDGTFFMSSNNGASWISPSDVNGGSSNTPKGIAVNSNNNIFVVDGGGSVWKSSNQGTSWLEQNSNYGGGSGTDDLIVDGLSNLYILFNSAIYKSSDDGVSWSVINSDYGGNQDGLTMISDSVNRFYIIDASGDVYRSTDFGISWTLISDFNGGNTDKVKGLTNFFVNTNISYQYKNCSSADCSDGTFIGPDGTSGTYFSSAIENFDLRGRYFQYRAYFSSGDTGVTPSINSVSLGYIMAAVAPNVTLYLPLEGSVFGTNESLALNYSISGDNIDSCWYTIDSGANNNSLHGCVNSTFSVSQSGDYILSLYSNESIAGLIGKDNVNFGVQIGAPEINIIFPTGGEYVNTRNISFVFNATSSLGVDSCSLYGNFTGNYAFNQTNTSVISGQQGYFFLSLENRTQMWSVYCNNSQGVVGHTENLSFIIDTSNPIVGIIEPNGTYNETDNIPLNYTVNDTSPLVQCTYNLSFSIGGQIVDVGVIGDCQNTLISVGTETSYDLLLTAQDQAGNAGSSTTNFIVGSGGGGGGGGSSGSGGGGSVPEYLLEITDLGTFDLRRGGSEIVNLEIINSGNRFLNGCKLSVVGPIADWISTEQVNSISPGEKSDFFLAVNVPNDAESGIHSSTIIVECKEFRKTTSLNVNVLSSNFDFIVLSSVKDGLKLVTTYSLKENTGKDQQIKLGYKLFNPQGIQVTEGVEEVFLGANQIEEKILEISLPKETDGVFTISFEVFDGSENFDLDYSVPLTGAITGFAISEDNLKTLSLFSVILLVLAGFVVAVKFVQKHYAKADSSSSGKFIPLKFK